MTPHPRVYLLLRALFLVFDQIFFIFAGKEDNHKSLDEFEFWLDSTSDCRVSCP